MRYDEVYEPREDSELVKKHIKNFSHGKVLDMGCGSGVLTLEAAQYSDSVLGVDINPKSIEYCKKNINNKKITFKRSDLFSNVSEKFDLIIFNPPYLPKDEGIEDNSLYGGKKGNETTLRFVEDAWKHLEETGFILIILSSLSQPKESLKKAKELGYEYEFIDEFKFAFESLYLYRLSKKHFPNVKRLRYFSKGARGLILRGMYNNKDVCIKIRNPESEAIGRIKNEAFFLKKLNKYNIGPEFVKEFEDYFIYQHVEGELMEKWLNKANYVQIKKVLKNILKKCYTMDKIGVNKEEMLRLTKNVVIKRYNVPVLLDFERAHHTKRPNNMTQCVQFMINKKEFLKKKGVHINTERLVKYSKDYKNKKRENFNKILKELK